MDDRPKYPGKKSHPGYHALRERKNHIAALIKMVRNGTVFYGVIGPDRQSLEDNLSNEYRAMHLAHRYCRGRTYRGAEPKTHGPFPNVIENMIFWQVNVAGGPLGPMPSIHEWLKGN